MKILLVTSRYPWPPRRGDQVRAVQALDFLADEHEVTLLAPTPDKDQPSPPEGAPYRIELYRLGGGSAVVSGLARSVLANLPLQAGLFYHPDLGRRLRELAPRHDLGILQLVRLALHVEDFESTPLVVDLIDSLALNFSKRAAVDRRWLAPLLGAEARRLALAERRLAERAERLLVVCKRDRQALAGRLPPELGAKVAEVRLAVAERQAEPLPDPEDPGREGDGPVLAMTGNLGYFVNADAVAWWLREVWPPLRRARPDVRLVVAGDRPSAALRRKVKRSGARLIESPPDLRSVLARATLALAPLRCGSGVPVKILEAWSAGVPVVASPWAAAGTSGRQGEDFLLAGDQPGDWVAAILRLLDDPAARRRLSDNGRRRLAADYSRETVRRQWLDAIRDAGAYGETAKVMTSVVEPP